MSRAGVLLLSYNDAQTIDEAVQSVALQPRCGELVAVLLADDASTDDTIARARAAAPTLPLTVMPAPRNHGPWSNLNRGLRELGEVADWAFVLHADDITVAGWLDALLTRTAQCAESVASISTSWDMLYGDRLEQTGERHSDHVRLIHGSKHAVHDTLLKGCWWKISGAAIRLRAFREVGDFDEAVPQCADWDWSMRALQLGWSFEYIPRVHTIYRQHAANLSTSALRDDVDIRDALIMMERFGYTLSKRELLGYYGRRGRYALRRMARGALRGDPRRIGTSMRTFTLLGRHLMKQLAA